VGQAINRTPDCHHALRTPSPITHDDCDEIFDAALQPLLVYWNIIPDIREAVYSAFYQEHSFQLDCCNPELHSSRLSAGKKLYYCWALYFPRQPVRMLIRKFVITLSFSIMDFRDVRRFINLEIHASAHVTLQIIHADCSLPTSWARELASLSSTLETRLHQSWKLYTSFTRRAFGDAGKLEIPYNGKIQYQYTLYRDRFTRGRNDTDAAAELQRHVEEDINTRITFRHSNRVD
jgi:hypothetical protein